MAKRLTVSALLLLLAAGGGAFVWRSASVPASTWPAFASPWPPAGVPALIVPAPPPPPSPSFCECGNCGWDGEYDWDEAGQNGREDDEPTPRVRLELTDSGSGQPTREPQAEAERLSPEATQELLAALPAAQAPPPTPPPAAAKTEPPPAADVLPPMTSESAGAPKPSRGPLRILRSGPTGEVAVAPQVALVFSEDMVPLGQKEVEIPGLRLVPQAVGRWRWAGTRLLLFDPVGRLPQATEFGVVVPAGLRSVSGSTLEKAHTWRFATPAPTLVDSHPHTGDLSLDEVLFLAFDQPVDPKQILPFVSIELGGKSQPLRLATADEVKADRGVRWRVRQAPEGHAVTLRTVRNLPRDTAVRITVRGVPGLEGPRRRKGATSWTMRTPVAFAIESSQCGFDADCPVGSPWAVRFNHPIDGKGFRPEMVRVEPEVEGFSVKHAGSSVCISGATRPRTTYRVILDGAIRDRSGSRLGETRTVRFSVGDVAPALVGPEESRIVLDAGSGPHFVVHSVGIRRLRIDLRQVGPGERRAYRRFLRKEGPPPGRRVAAWTEMPMGDGLVATSIDLSPALHDGVGQLLLRVEPDGVDVSPYVTWIEMTRLGLETTSDGRRLLARVTALRTGRPVPGARVTLRPGGTWATTDGRGLVDLPVLAGAPHRFVVASLGDDAAILEREGYYDWGDGEIERPSPQVATDGLMVHAATDRGVYRPGETVLVKGYVRRLEGYPLRRVVPGQRVPLTYRLVGSSGSDGVQGTADVDSKGAFSLAIPLPTRTERLGMRLLEFPGTLSPVAATLRVEEFRRPQVELSLEGRERAGAARFEARASSFEGTALGGIAVRWVVRARPARYAPPGHAGFAFGAWEDKAEATESLVGRSDAQGGASIESRVGAGGKPSSYVVQATAVATDEANNTASASSSVLWHPSDVHIGLRSAAFYGTSGQPLRIAVVTVDDQGRPVPGRPVSVVAQRQSEENEAEKPSAVREATMGREPVEVRLPTGRPGRYVITATTKDGHGRLAQTQLSAFVLSPEGLWRPDAKEEVSIRADRERYAPGDVARLDVRSAFAEGEGVLTLWHVGRIVSRPFRLTKGRATIEVPVASEWAPGVLARVDLDGAGRAHGSASVRLEVEPKDRRLGVSVRVDEPRVRPGSRTGVTVSVRDSSGAAVKGAEVAVFVVDEAVLALTRHALSDPLVTFHPRFEPRLVGENSRVDVHAGGLTAEEAVRLLSAQLSFGGGVAGGIVGGIEGGVPGGVAGLEPVALREDLRLVALFEASLLADASGEARITVPLPESLTRFRVMALASADLTRFGTGEASIATSLPLELRPAPPRFLRTGDEAGVGVLVVSRADEPLDVDVALRAHGVRLTQGAGRRVQIAPRGRTEVRFPVVAGDEGEAVFDVVARAGADADATSFRVPVRRAVERETVATYGTVGDGPLVQALAWPAEVIPGSEEVDFTTSTSLAAGGTDVAVHLGTYRFECAEQVASRILAITTIAPVLERLGVGGLSSPQERLQRLRVDLRRLDALRTKDGRYDYWPGMPGDAFVTVHVAHALVRAAQLYPRETGGKARGALDGVRSIPAEWTANYEDEQRLSIRAYALYVRRLGDEDVSAEARRMVRESEVSLLPGDAVGWLLGALRQDHSQETARLVRAVEGRVSETTGSAQIVTGTYRDEGQAVLSSSLRTDAVVLDGLLFAAPESDLVAKLSRMLLARRGWISTQESSQLLVALAHLVQSEHSDPSMRASVWADDELIFREVLVGATAGGSGHVDRRPARLTFAREGTGPLHFRLAMRYSLDPLRLPAVDEGFAVERSYEALDDEDDVRRDASGTWHLRSGSRVRVRVTVSAEARRNHVAVVMPLPAGVDPLFSAAAGELRGWRAPWSHVQSRDDGLEAFATGLDAGVWCATLDAVALTPGRYATPPARAEEMYAAEVFGRGAAELVVIE